METSAPRIRAPVWWHYMVPAAFVVLFLWGWYIMENYFGLNLKGRPLPRDRGPISLWVPSISTPLIFIWAYYHYWKTSRFLAHAVQVTAQVNLIGLLEMKGFRDITYLYYFRGNPYHIKRSVKSTCVKGLTPGAQIPILVNPANPKQSRLVAEF